MNDLGVSVYLQIKVVLSDGHQESHRVYLLDLAHAVDDASKVMKDIDAGMGNPVLSLSNPNVSYNTAFVARVEFEIQFEGEGHLETSRAVQQEFANRTIGFRTG